VPTTPPTTTPTTTPTIVAAAGAQPRVPAAAAPPAAETEVQQLRRTIDQLSDSVAGAGQGSGLPLRGFADVSAAQSSRGDPQRVRGFNAGTLDIYLTPQIGDRVKGLAETVFEYDPDGRGHIEVERLQLGYTASDALTLWAGRFHTPIGIWNTLYHHGAQLQPTLARPRFIDFEDRGGVLPTHTVGVWATGKTRWSAGWLTYDGFVGNGPRIRERELDPNAASDDNAGRLAGINVGMQPSGPLGGLAVGLHAMRTTVDAYAGSGVALNRTRLRLFGGYLTYDSDGWDAIAEWHRLANTDPAAGLRRNSTLWFAQLGHGIGAWTPYLRVERADLDAADPYFASQLSGRPYRRALVGVRFDPEPRASLKFELSRTAESATTQIDGTGLAVPFAATRYRRAAVEYAIAF
jgi:hypothetical protein